MLENSSMNKNVLKVVAILSMLIDHIGYLLLPGVAVLRVIGRIAMPLFAFSIGEGCLYTKNKLRYFLQVFILGLVCQIAYLADDLIMNQGFTQACEGFYFNILLTFSGSILLCYAYLYFKKSLDEQKDNQTKLLRLFLFLGSLILALTLDLVFKWLRSEAILTNILFDYEFMGMILPLFAVVAGEDLWKRKAIFAIGIIAFALMEYTDITWIIGALSSLVFLIPYNGEKGKLKMKYAFYIFYPVHLVVLYLILILTHP